MAVAVKIEAIEDLPRTPASDVKKLGWRGVMKSVAKAGKLVVTNHNQPEAVILSTGEYAALMDAAREAGARRESALEELRRGFDQRLASLQAADAGDRLRSLMREPARLAGKVKTGTGR